MNHRIPRSISVVAFFTFAFALALPAAAEVGTVAAAEGTAEIGRNGYWIPAAAGTAIVEKDELRTGQPGHLKVVFQDDSVLTLSDNSHLTVDRQVFNPATQQAHSLFALLRGKVHALVSDYYHRANTAFTIKTRNTVCGVRGTEFLTSYDPDTDVTKVIGITGVVSVRSAVDPTAPGILITAREATSVVAGEPPTAPQQLQDKTFKQYLQGVNFISPVGAGLGTGHAIAAGASVPLPDRAPAIGAGSQFSPATANGPGGISQAPNAGNLLGQSPAALKGMTGSIGIDVGKH